MTHKFWKLCVSHNSISSLRWVLWIQHLWDKIMFRFQMSNGKILEDYSKQKNNSNKWFFSQLNIPKNSWNSECSHLRESYSMDHRDVERHCWQRQLPISAVLTLFQLRAHNYLRCISVKVSQMFEMFLIKQELLLLVYCFLTS